MSLRHCISSLICSAAIACGGEAVVEPTPSPSPPAPPPPPAAVFPSLGITPDTAALAPGEALLLLVRALDQNNKQVDLLSVEWSSSAPDVATVSSSGEVKGVAPGAALITATVTVGRVMGATRMVLRVLPVPASTSVVLAAGPYGWLQSAAYLKTGGTVEWTSGPGSWAGVSATSLWLMDFNYRVVDSLDFRSGSAKRTFNERGVFIFCSGGCWDPPEYGTIFVQ